jgi:phage tail sheath protein FI
MLPAVTSPILGVATSTAALVGEAGQGPVEQPELVTSLSEYERVFGGGGALPPAEFLVLCIRLGRM